MKFGVLIFPAESAIRPDELAVELEKREFESLFIPEHSHIPASRATPWGGVEGAPPLPDQYWRSRGRFAARAYSAAVTAHLRLATGITLVAQRDPIWTAKEVASLDHLSDGRLIFGIGYGWNKEEMAHHGVAYRDRRSLLREKVLMMKSLWTDEEASFEGEHLRLEPSWARPKPKQRPNPPILMGAAAGPKTLADIVEFCDGWIPLGNRHDIVDTVSRVRRAVEEAGRDPDAFDVTAFAVKPDHIEELQRAGVDRAIFSVPPIGRDDVIPRLDRLASAIG